MRDGVEPINPIIARIQREVGVPDLVAVLAERLNPTDLQSLLLEVYRRRAASISPASSLSSMNGTALRAPWISRRSWW